MRTARTFSRPEGLGGQEAGEGRVDPAGEADDAALEAGAADLGPQEVDQQICRARSVLISRESRRIVHRLIRLRSSGRGR